MNHNRNSESKESDPPFKFSPDGKTVMTWRTFWVTLAIVASGVLTYAGFKNGQEQLKSEQMYQGHRIDSLDRRMESFERNSERQTEILITIARDRRLPIPPEVNSQTVLAPER